MKSKKESRLYEEKLNNQQSLMKIIEYNNNRDIIVEFQDEHKTKVRTTYQNFSVGEVKNPYYPNVFEIGMLGVKYPAKENGKNTKEYTLWFSMLERCYYKKFKEHRRTYENAFVCDEWLTYENFYEWLHKQPNFDKWLNEDRWCLDKDIVEKGNKIYSPNSCYLVPENVNLLFGKNDISRGDLPIGVTYHKRIGKYNARISKVGTNGKYREHLGYYNTPEEAFYVYKKAKESHIKQIAQLEYFNGNITKECYESMMKYEVEITD